MNHSAAHNVYQAIKQTSINLKGLNTKYVLNNNGMKLEKKEIWAIQIHGN